MSVNVFLHHATLYFKGVVFVFVKNNRNTCNNLFVSIIFILCVFFISVFNIIIIISFCSFLLIIFSKKKLWNALI